MPSLFQLPIYPPQFWLAAVSTALLIGVSKAGFGGGPGVIATPLLSLVMPVPEAAALLLPILLLADVFAVRHYYDQVDKQSLRVLLPGALLGILLGALFFRQFSDQDRVLKLGIGVIALAFVLYQAVRSRILRISATLLAVSVGRPFSRNSWFGTGGSLMVSAARALLVMPPAIPSDIPPASMVLRLSNAHSSFGSNMADIPL